MTQKQDGKRPVSLPLLLFSVVFLVGMSAIFLWGPLSPRFDDSRVFMGVFFAIAALVVVVVSVRGVNPEGAYAQRHADLQAALALGVGEPAVLFAGILTTKDSAERTVEGLRALRRPWPASVLCAVGPSGVMLGRPGRRGPRTVTLAKTGDVVRFRRGGAGGFFLRPRSDSTPRLRIDIERAGGTDTVVLDQLVSPTRPLEVRDESEVAMLLDQIAQAQSRD
ncbi:hypothetical protein [Microcella pacifica]|uniref:Uncharacterized protein n=1 Tax=Microcella pacifica TaxID=2591847 RepID=A0A9E5JL08_9MICO|nr:hypothetical protein [Microcella pacifica]NHF62483.1 hypothetical protein [Microcella pacifica]